MAVRSDVNAHALAEFKEHYRETIPEAWVRGANDALLASLEMKADEDGFGRTYVHRVRYSAGSAMGTWAGARTIAANKSFTGAEPGVARFEINPIQLDHATEFNRAEFLGAKGKPDEQFDIMDVRSRAGMAEMRRRLGIQLAGDGNGWFARVSAITNDTITLGSASGATDGKWFTNRVKKGDQVIFDDTITGASQRTGNYEVEAVDYSAGTITVNDIDSANTAATNGVLAGDYIFFRYTTSTVGNVWAGIQQWMSSAALFGVTRTGTELGGFPYVATTGADIGGQLIHQAMQLYAHGKTPNRVYISPREWAVYTADKDITKIVQMTVSKMSIGFKSIKLDGGPLDIDVFPSMYMPPGVNLMGNFTDEEKCPYILHGSDEIVSLDDLGDGLPIRRNQTTGNFEVGQFHLGQIVFGDPTEFSLGSNFGS